MIVYGDPQFKTSPAELFAGLRERAFECREDDLDALRALLIQAGQLEQALEDGCPNETETILARKLTELAADAFLSCWLKTQPTLVLKTDGSGQLEQLREKLRNSPKFSSQSVTVKIPEGFAFYALFPEQYCLAALSWHQCNIRRRTSDTVLVVGIRSIGTALSALVAATLKVAGWCPIRLTVRPDGPPFARITKLPTTVRRQNEPAMVVDEGPGLSGSSMASIAKALVKAGFFANQISFFPGHAGEPGNAASDEVRAWWSKIQRYVTTWEQLHWNGLNLAQSLLKKSGELQCSAVEDISCGRWRAKIWHNESDWPWTPIPFERMKFLCRAQNGDSILWKFSGLQKPHPSTTKSQASLLSPVGYFRGCTPYRWIDGEPLTFAEGENPAIIQQIAQHIASASKPPPCESEQSASFERLREMLFWNTKEALDDEFADRAMLMIKDIPTVNSCPSCGGGRMAPYEWRRLKDGRIVKLNPTGRDADHTIVGRQPIYWDAAGAMIEWRLLESQILLSALKECGVPLAQNVLQFYQAAYAAFRMGQASLCADACAGDPIELSRTRKAFENYREQLRFILANG